LTAIEQSNGGIGLVTAALVEKGNICSRSDPKCSLSRQAAYNFRFGGTTLTPSTTVLHLLYSICQGKVEMSPLWQSRNVVFCLGLSGLHVNLRVPVKRRRALLASNPIKE
jgi:hypothetical protein